MRKYLCTRTDAHSIAECRDHRGPKVFVAPKPKAK